VYATGTIAAMDGGAPPSAAPHWLQSFDRGGFVAPQSGHGANNGAAH
jgi:hypothetical protein